APIASFDEALFQLDAASNASSDSDVSSAARRSHGRRFATTIITNCSPDN
ncbi:MAG: hypothetical protein ACI8UD_004422, partial [Planctomycetota bacterium]